MCGRFALDDHVNELIEEFVATGGDYDDWVPAFSIAPTNRAPIVRERASSDGAVQRSIDLATWGLRPAWAKPGGPAPINARMETLATNGMFRTAFAGQRCLVPMTGYFEWTEEKDGKQPHFIHGGGGTPTLAAAGLYAARKDGDSWAMSFTIATREARDAGGALHERMPVFLESDTWGDWLNPAKAGTAGGPEASALVALLEESSTAVAKTLESHPVDRRVNNTRAADPRDAGLIEALTS